MQLNYFSCSFFIFCILLNVIGTNSALRCYHCSDCKNSALEIEECGSSAYQCYKLNAGDLVSKGCIRSETCSVQDIEIYLRDIWHKFSSAFGSDSREDDSERLANCCEDDLCNGALTLTNWAGLSGLLTLGIIVTYFRG